MKPYSIHPTLKYESLKNGNHSIQLRIMVKGENIKVTTGYYISKNLWDNKAQLPKNNPLRTVISKIVTDLETHLLTEQATGGELSIQLIKDYFGGKKKIKPENGSFYDYYLEFVENKKKEGKDADTIRIGNNIPVI